MKIFEILKSINLKFLYKGISKAIKKIFVSQYHISCAIAILN